MGNSPIFRILVGFASIIILIAGLQAFAEFISPILLALFLAIILSPLFHWLQGKGLPTWLAMLIMIVGILGIGLGLVLLVVVSFAQLVDQMSSYEGEIAGLVDSFQAWLAEQGIVLSDIQLSEFVDLSGVASWLFNFLTELGGILFTVAIIFLIIIFAMLESSSYGRKLAQGLGADNPALARFTGFTRSLVRYLVLRAGVNLITGGLVAIMLLLLGIDYAVLWGVLTFFLSFVPYVGIVLATIPSVFLGLVQGGPLLALVIIIGVTIINFSAENIVAPKMMGRGLSLSPLVVFLSFFFWSWILGPLGMFLSMPMTVMVWFVLDSIDETRWLAILMSEGKLPETTTPA